jgi:hypothetical protein
MQCMTSLLISPWLREPHDHAPLGLQQLADQPLVGQRANLGAIVVQVATAGLEPLAAGTAGRCWSPTARRARPPGARRVSTKSRTGHTLDAVQLRHAVGKLDTCLHVELAERFA